MKLFLSVLSLFYMGNTPGRGAVISPSGVIWYVMPSQAAACDTPLGTRTKDPAFIPASKALRLASLDSYGSPGKCVFSK